MIKNALLSVSDKTGIVDFAKGLVDLGVTTVSYTHLITRTC